MNTIRHELAVALALVAALAACRGKEASPPDEAEHHGAKNETIIISTASQAAMDMKVARLATTSMPETLTVVGRILQDAQTCHHIPAEVPGTVASVVASLGQEVAMGTDLAIIRGRDGQESNVTSGFNGVVTASHVSPGDAVDEGTFLFSVTEVDPLWGVLDVHERNLAKIRVGQRVDIRSAAYADSAFQGRITFVSPEIDSVTRTVKARVAISNPAGKLKLGMFLDASVRLDSGSKGLFVPRVAVQTLPEGPVVFAQTGPTEFRPFKVSLGREHGEWVQITEGVNAGDNVVISGAFLVKSEMLNDQLEEHGH